MIIWYQHDRCDNNKTTIEPTIRKKKQTTRNKRQSYKQHNMQQATNNNQPCCRYKAAQEARPGNAYWMTGSVRMVVEGPRAVVVLVIGGNNTVL